MGDGASEPATSTRAPLSTPGASEASHASAGATTEFESVFLPHMDAAWALARFLLRDTADAEDVVQESYLKAWRSFHSFRGEASRAWLLSIVRNTCFTWLRRNRQRSQSEPFDDAHEVAGSDSPERQFLGLERKRLIGRCIDLLPAGFREILIMREIEDLSYGEIASATGVPSGTVMSRLSRARARVANCLKERR